MKAYTYIEKGKFALTEKPEPVLQNDTDAIVKVTLASIYSSDLHIKHGSVPRAVPGITVGHEMVGIVESVGSAVTSVKPGDRVTVNVETFCGECFFAKRDLSTTAQTKMVAGHLAAELTVDRPNISVYRMQIGDLTTFLIPFPMNRHFSQEIFWLQDTGQRRFLRLLWMIPFSLLVQVGQESVHFCVLC